MGLCRGARARVGGGDDAGLAAGNQQEKFFSSQKNAFYFAGTGKNAIFAPRNFI